MLLLWWTCRFFAVVARGGAVAGSASSGAGLLSARCPCSLCGCRQEPDRGSTPGSAAARIVGFHHCSLDSDHHAAVFVPASVLSRVNSLVFPPGLPRTNLRRSHRFILRRPVPCGFSARPSRPRTIGGRYHPTRRPGSGQVPAAQVHRVRGAEGRLHHGEGKLGCRPDGGGESY